MRPYDQGHQPAPSKDPRTCASEPAEVPRSSSTRAMTTSTPDHNCAIPSTPFDRAHRLTVMHETRARAKILAYEAIRARPHTRDSRIREPDRVHPAPPAAHRLTRPIRTQQRDTQDSREARSTSNRARQLDGMYGGIQLLNAYTCPDPLCSVAVYLHYRIPLWNSRLISRSKPNPI